jgi:hypothetical protein
MEYHRSHRNYIEQSPTSAATTPDVVSAGGKKTQRQALGNEAVSLMMKAAAPEDTMTAPTQKRFKTLREVPIDDPIDRAEYRRYRIDQMLSKLPADASEDLRAWVVEAETKRMDSEQGISS